MINITEIIASARRTVHETFGVAALYFDPHTGKSAEISVRWHNRVALHGNLDDDGYTDIIEGVNRVFLNVEELKQKGIVPFKGARLTMLHPLHNGAILLLDSQEPVIGPVNQVWNITVKKDSA